MNTDMLLKTTLCILVVAGAASATAAMQPTAGNEFYYSSANSAVVNSVTDARQFSRFTALENASANSISINLNQVSVGANITIGLQLDDGTGVPTGTFVAQGSLAPATGWNTVNFSNYALEAGKVYHVVVQATSGNVSWRLLTGTPSHVLPQGYIDPNFGRGGVTAGVPSAVVTNSSVVYRVGTTGTLGLGSVFTGSLYSNAAIVASGPPPAQRFIFNAPETGNFIQSVSLLLNIAATPPANDLSVVLLNDMNQILGQTSISADLMVAGTAFYEADFAEAIGLTDGEAYRLAIYSIGSTGNSVRWVNLSTADEYAKDTFQGTDGYVFSYSGTDFLTTTTPLVGRDHVFQYVTIPEPATCALAFVGLAGVLIARRRNF